MTARFDIDASRLPDIAFGIKAPIWWGQLWMMAIESTIFLILIAAYFYTRMGFSVWPPPRDPTPGLLLPTLNLVVLALSCLPMRWSGKAGVRERIGAAAFWLAVGAAMAIGALAIRWYELAALQFKWNTDVYGSYVWSLLGLHTLHLIADTVESLVILLVLGFGRVGGKQQQALEVDGLYWYFVVGAYFPLYLLIYVYPRLLKG